MDVGSEKIESCDDEADEAIECSYGPHDCGTGGWKPSKRDCVAAELILCLRVLRKVSSR